CFLVGSAAIAALPPLNGFVSEWLTFVALPQNTRIAPPMLNLVFALGVAGLALTSGLAMACFVKAFGITFLALPRGDAAARAHEAPPAMRAAMVALAVVCVALGLGATLVVPALVTVAGALTGDRAPVAVGDWLTLGVSGGFATLSTLAIAVPPGGALLCPAHRVREPDALDLRRLALSAGPRRAALRRSPGAGDPVGQRQRLPRLHFRGAPPLAGARMIATLLIALGQVLVAG